MRWDFCAERMESAQEAEKEAEKEADWKTERRILVPGYAKF